ncbi:MAG: DNA polymerase III subunit delta' [Pseudomonadota bacterium]
MNARPEPDCMPGAPHPRETEHIFGQDAAIRAFFETCASNRLHHAWLIIGPRGIGKATLAWKIARFLLTTPSIREDGSPDAPLSPESLLVDPAHPVARRMAALSEPGLFLLRRPFDEKTDRLKQDITIDEVRKLKDFFSLSATDGGRRVVIVDAADELNGPAANALLKILEEPPARVHFLLIGHRPWKLLATIRSRCRVLRCQTLGADDLRCALRQARFSHTTPGIAELAAGSVGQAVRLASLGGTQIYEELVALFATIPNIDRPGALKLADSAVGRQAADRFALLTHLLELFLSRLARTGVIGTPPEEATEGEAALLQRLCPCDAAARDWAELTQTLSARSQHGRAVNLDPAALILDMVLKIDQMAARLAAR